MKKRKENESDSANGFAVMPDAAFNGEHADDGENAIRARSDESAGSDFMFKKSFYGYDTDEVNDYISEITVNAVATGKVYEQKINELKDELALCCRERDSYKEAALKIKHELEVAQSAAHAAAPEDINAELEQKIAAEQEKYSRKADEYEKIIAGLNTAIVKAENEIQRLAAYEINANELYNANLELTGELAGQKQKNNDLRLEIARYAEIAAAYEGAVAEKERLMLENAAINKSFKETENELIAKNESFSALSAEKEKLRVQISEISVKYSVMCRQSEKAEAEAADLKDKNKTQAYEFAAKVNELEALNAKERLNLQKNMQVNAYHIKQMKMLTQELLCQVEQVEKSFEETDIFH